MSASQKSRANFYIIRPSGKLDQATTPDFDKFLIQVVEKTSANIVVDMSKVTLVTSTGLRILLNTIRKLSEKSIQLRMTGVNEVTMEIFQMSGFDHCVEIHVDEASAVRDWC